MSSQDLNAFVVDRRPVNSTVMLLHLMNVMRILLVVSTFLLLGSPIFGQDSETRLGNPITREQILELDRQPIVVEAVPAIYPAVAIAARAEGRVIVEIQIDSNGTVTSAHALEGAPTLRPISEWSALRWRFTPANGSQRNVV